MMATFHSDHFAQMDSAANAPGYSRTSRRQYQSCDQCRKSRRACDAGTLGVVNFPLREDHNVPKLLDGGIEACSNCSRTHKSCTFDWLRSLPLQGLPKGVKRKLESTSGPDLAVVATNLKPATKTKQPSSIHDSSSPSPTRTSSAESVSSNSEHASQPELARPENSEIKPNLNAESASLPLVDGRDAKFPQQAIRNEDYPEGSQLEEVTNGHGCDVPSFTRNDTASSSSSSDSVDSVKPKTAPQASPTLTSISSASSLGKNESTDHQSPKAAKRGRFLSDSMNHFPSPKSQFRRHSTTAAISSNGRRQSLTPLSTNQVRFADGAMKSMIATGLLRIYHDSFENSLSCWVTERNCPYETELFDLAPRANLTFMTEEASLRLGDNRIFSRVSRLDTAFGGLRARDLTPRENRAASKALHAAIMAFASQWSHSSHNAFWQSKDGASQTKLNNMLPPSNRPGESPLSSECERMIQRTLWHEAQTAIQATAEIDSFKVILAYMIFALTQRPINANRRSPTSPENSTGNDQADSRRTSEVFEEMPDLYTAAAADALANEDWNPFHANDIEALASPPIYLETAVRNLFSWRRKVERYRRMIRQAQFDNGHAPAALSLKDQQTFNILFWLGVMCDTTSSAISKRPLVIPDEDCAMIRENLEHVAHRGSQIFGSCGVEEYDDSTRQEEVDTGALWGSYLLSFKWAGPRERQPRWPCTFNEAALVLQEAIPVKVLMFRKVGQLQTLAYRRSPPRQLEKCIEEALEVYQHWNMTYGQFMNDCVDSHNDLPPHVQSWYVILAGHWHYGCLLFADTVSQVDREQKTMRPQRTLRATCNLIRELRKDNARAIARIAQASLSEHVPSVPNNPEFHFVCSGSAILTEPWTDVLVRAMGSACKIFINWLASWKNSADPSSHWVRANASYDDLYTQAEACIQGMGLLGRKSDAANYTADVFWTRLNRVCSSQGYAHDMIKHERLSPWVAV